MKWHHVVAAAAIGLPLAGQSSSNQVGGSSDAARIEQQAQKMRDNIDAGRRIQSHVRVAVRLKNGNKLIGVVKDGKMVERVDGLRFVDAQAKDRGAGIRLWYTSGARNYVFIPFADFAQYEVLAQLSAEQLAVIESEMQMEERRRAERAAATAARATAAGEGAPAPADGDMPVDPVAPVAPTKTGKAAEKAAERAAEAEKALAAAKAASEAEQQQRLWFSLLQDYPPAAGWNKTKRDEISKRFVVVGAQPSEHEKRFVATFGQWEKACAHFRVDTAAAKKEGEEPAEESGRRGGRSKREK